jgi:hypothetical protein
MKSARVLHEAREAIYRLPVSGKVRPGTKILTSAAQACPVGDQLADILERGIRARATFDRIEAAMAKIDGAPRTPLIPTNGPEFRVCPADFTTPGAVDEIITRYADDDGELRSFPIVFPSEEIDLIFRESFESWKAGKLHRWSEPSPESGDLQCMHRLEPDPKAKRIQWGGRPTEAVRDCNPNDCDLFGKGECKHHGSLYFWIPGVTGAGVIEMSFTSVYASAGIVEMIGVIRKGIGKISGLYRGTTIFRISKSLKSVSRVDWEKGKVAKSKHWIIQLSADLDMCERLPTPEDSIMERAEFESLIHTDIDETIDK